MTALKKSGASATENNFRHQIYSVQKNLLNGDIKLYAVSFFNTEVLNIKNIFKFDRKKLSFQLNIIYHYKTEIQRMFRIILKIKLKIFPDFFFA
jgi:hypothetical protein